MSCTPRRWNSSRLATAMLLSSLLFACQKPPAPPPVVVAPPKTVAPAPATEAADKDASTSTSSDAKPAEPVAKQESTAPVEPAAASDKTNRLADAKESPEKASPADGKEPIAAKTENAESAIASASADQATKQPGEAVVAKVTESKTPATVDTPHERILVLTPGGPIVIDLLITLQGAGYDKALGRLVDEAFKVADEDGDGKATWKNVVENPKFRSGQFGNLVADTDDERQQLVRIYDSDRDGMVDREELPRFLTRNSGGGRSFSLRSSNEYRSSNRSRSATRLLLDADRDGAITTAEMDAAPTILLNRDADDDEIVVVAELKNSIETMNAPTPTMSNRRRTSEPDTAIWLSNPSVDFNKRWGLVQFLLQELYSFGEKMHAADWPLTPELFRQIDTDSNGELQRSEFSKLLDVPAHLVIEAAFDGGNEKERGPRIKLRQLSSELAEWKPTVRELPTRLSLQLPDVELEFFVNEDPSLSNAAQAAKAQFMAFDKDKNGYLEKGELPAQAPGMDATFESFDANSDGKVYEDEVVAYLEQRSAVSRSQVRARAADQEDALFTALDTDGDGRLNTREIRESPFRLREIDRNGDGKLQSPEIPGSMVVGFVRGSSQQDAQLFAGPATVAKTGDSSIPRWFRGMDANADGEISRREFFGDQDQFDRIDSNHDGFLLRDEAQAAKP